MMRNPWIMPAASEPTGEIDLRALGAALRRRRRACRRCRRCSPLSLIGDLRQRGDAALHRADPGPAGEPGNLLHAARSRQPAQRAISRTSSTRRPWRARCSCRPRATSRAAPSSSSHLEGNREFDPLAGGMNPLTRVLVLLGIVPDPTRETREARMVHELSSRSSTCTRRRRRASSTIEFTSRDPELAARAANEVAALYLQEQSGGQTRAWRRIGRSAGGADRRSAVPSSPRPTTRASATA